MSHLIQGHEWGRTGDCFDMESPNPVFWLTPKHNCSSSCVAINVLFSCCTENVIYLTQTPGPLLCLLSKMALCLTEHMDRKSSSSFPLKLSKKGSSPISSELSENTTAHNENTISSNLIRICSQSSCYHIAQAVWKEELCTKQRATYSVLLPFPVVLQSNEPTHCNIAASQPWGDMRCSIIKAHRQDF